MASKTTDNVREVLNAVEDGKLDVKPIFGICLGNHGQNQPVVNLLSRKCVITPQNHGFALVTDALPDGWMPLFVNRNDGSNEGIMHKTLPWFTAQFHPEAKCGPSDTSFIFDLFASAMTDPKAPISNVLSAGLYTPPAVQLPLKKVLLLGSGA